MDNLLLKHFSKSQAKQDIWVCEQLDNKKNGFFVDVGAHDGIFISNTFLLEKNFNWSGICIEADSNRFKDLCHNRDSINIPIAVRNYSGTCDFTKACVGLNDGYVGVNSRSGDIPCDTLHHILLANAAPRDIDYISLDIEGLELEVLSSFPFDSWNVNLWTIEHNMYVDGTTNKEKIYDIMTKAGYERVVEDAKAQVGGEMVPFEDWYKKK
jgi:FkbM family methyltransferase